MRAFPPYLWNGYTDLVALGSDCRDMRKGRAGQWSVSVVRDGDFRSNSWSGPCFHPTVGIRSAPEWRSPGMFRWNSMIWMEGPGLQALD